MNSNITKKKHSFRVCGTDAEGFEIARIVHAWKIEDARMPTNCRGWFAYRETFGRHASWWLVEGRTGLAVSRANTLANAVESFLCNEVRIMTWAGLAANRRDIEELPTEWSK